MDSGRVWTDGRFPGVACRRAAPTDLPDLLALKSSREADYLPEVLPGWLEDGPGGVYAFYYEDLLCGLVSIHLAKPHEAWLRGKRIARGVEGRGLGTATAWFELVEARRLGARVARLVAAAGNEAVHHMMRDKLGFRQVGRWWVGELPPGAVRGPAAAGVPQPAGGGPGDQELVTPEPADLEQGLPPGLSDLLAVHGRATGGDAREGDVPAGYGRWGLVAAADDPLTLHTFDREDLVREAAGGRVRLAAAGDRVAGLVLTGPEGETPYVRLFLAGEPETGVVLARWLARRAGEAPLRVSLPAGQAARLVGGDAQNPAAPGGRVFVVYERPLDG